MDISFSFIAQSDDEVETASGTERAALNRTLQASIQTAC